MACSVRNACFLSIDTSGQKEALDASMPLSEISAEDKSVSNIFCSNISWRNPFLECGSAFFIWLPPTAYRSINKYSAGS